MIYSSYDSWTEDIHVHFINFPFIAINPPPPLSSLIVNNKVDEETYLKYGTLFKVGQSIPCTVGNYWNTQGPEKNSFFNYNPVFNYNPLFNYQIFHTRKSTFFFLLFATCHQLAAAAAMGFLYAEPMTQSIALLIIHLSMILGGCNLGGYNTRNWYVIISLKKKGTKLFDFAVCTRILFGFLKVFTSPYSPPCGGGCAEALQELDECLHCLGPGTRLRCRRYCRHHHQQRTVGGLLAMCWITSRMYCICLLASFFVTFLSE